MDYNNAIPGQNVTVGQGLGIDTSSNSDTIGYADGKGRQLYHLWGHKLMIEDGNYACVSCGEAQAVPEIIKRSTGFREAVCKMIAFGHFKRTKCDESLKKKREREQRKKQRELQKQHDRLKRQSFYTTDTYTTDTSSSGDVIDMYIPQGDKYQIGGSTYIYRGDGSWTSIRGHNYTTEQLVRQHQQDALDALPTKAIDELAQNAKVGVQNMPHTNSSKSSDTSATDNLKQGDATSTAEKFIKQKFAEKLLNRK